MKNIGQLKVKWIILTFVIIMSVMIAAVAYGSTRGVEIEILGHYRSDRIVVSDHYTTMVNLNYTFIVLNLTAKNNNWFGSGEQVNAHHLKLETNTGIVGMEFEVMESIQSINDSTMTIVPFGDDLPPNHSFTGTIIYAIQDFQEPIALLWFRVSGDSPTLRIEL